MSDLLSCGALHIEHADTLDYPGATSRGSACPLLSGHCERPLMRGDWTLGFLLKLVLVSRSNVLGVVCHKYPAAWTLRTPLCRCPGDFVGGKIIRAWALIFFLPPNYLPYFAAHNENISNTLDAQMNRSDETP